MPAKAIVISALKPWPRSLPEPSPLAKIRTIPASAAAAAARVRDDTRSRLTIQPTAAATNGSVA